jgi:hypothetical protein
MPKSKIQPLVPLILRRLQINPPLLLTHRTPNLLPRPIPPNIIPFSKKKQHQRQNTEPDQHAVAAVIQRFVVFAVDVRAYDPAELDGHVVASG